MTEDEKLSLALRILEGGGCVEERDAYVRAPLGSWEEKVAKEYLFLALSRVIGEPFSPMSSHASNLLNVAWARAPLEVRLRS